MLAASTRLGLMVQITRPPDLSSLQEPLLLLPWLHGVTQWRSEGAGTGVAVCFFGSRGKGALVGSGL